MKIIKFRLAVICEACGKVSFRFGTLCPTFRIVEDGDESCPHCHSYRISVIKEGRFQQSTGLQDSKGVEIFEGDIIKWDDASQGKYWRVAEVVWDKGGWCFRIIPNRSINCYTGKFGDRLTHDFHMGNFIYCPNSSEHGNVMEVIGNIHSVNP